LLCFLTLSKRIAEVEIITCGDNDNYLYNYKEPVGEGGGEVDTALLLLLLCYNC